MNPIMERRAVLVSLAGLPLGMTGCGGGDAAPAGGGGGNAGAIGPAGGTVDGPAGSRLTVPAGALAADTPVALAASGSGAPALPAGFVPMGTMFAITPHGTSFATPATVSLPIEAGAVPTGSVPVLFKTNAQGQWELVPGAAVQGDAVVASIGGLSWFNLGQLPPHIVVQPADSSVAAPAAATFSVVVGAGTNSYQWQRSNDGATWSAIAGATQASYTTGATAAATSTSGGDDGALFRVVIASAAGSSTSRAARLTVAAAVVATGLRIAAGSGYSIAAQAAGNVRSWGISSEVLGDVIGLGNRLVPGPVLAVAGVRAVAAGVAHALALTASGTVWAWGYNGFGQLCNATFDPLPHGLPALANGVTNVIAIAAGFNHSLFLKADGTVWSAGRNHLGQLGDGTLVDRNLSRPVSGLGGVVAIAAGGNHCLALRGDGSVWAWGDNASGQLGDGGTAASATPVQVAGLTNAIRVAAGAAFSLALVRENPTDPFGVLWGWGANDRGQLASDPIRASLLRAEMTHRAPLSDIAAGTVHALHRHFDGTVFACGDNRRGQLGDPGFGGALSAAPRWVSGLPSGIVAVSAGWGFGHSLAHAGDGSVWAWGDNQTGQLGRGSEGSFSATPAAAAGLGLN